MLIENKLAVGTLTIRAIIRRDPKELIDNLADAGFGVTLSMRTAQPGM